MDKGKTVLQKSSVKTFIINQIVDEKEFRLLSKAKNLNLNDLLSKSLLYLKSKTQSSEEPLDSVKSLRDYTEEFLTLINTYFFDILKLFSQAGRSYRVVVKLIELSDWVLLNLEGDIKQYKEFRTNISKSLSILIKRFCGENDWRTMRKTFEVQNKF